MVYNRGRQYSRPKEFVAEGERWDQNDIDVENPPKKVEYSIEQQTLKNTKSILSKVTQISYQISALEDAVYEILEVIRLAKSEHDKGI